MQNRNRIRIALARPADRGKISEEIQRDRTEQANAVRKHDQAARAARTGRSPVRLRWGRPPG